MITIKEYIKFIYRNNRKLNGMKSVKLKENESKLKVFEFILREGPITTYDITKEFEQMEPANITRVMKRLQTESAISYVESEYISRKKKLFGPTILGLLCACADDDRFRKNFELYYNKWIEIPQFRESAQQLIKDELLRKNPDKAIEVLLKYLDYIEDSISCFSEHKSKLPVEVQVFFGEMLMQMYHPVHTKERTDEFYKYVIPFKTNALAFMDRIADMKKEFEKNSPALHSAVGSDYNELYKKKKK